VRRKSAFIVSEDRASLVEFPPPSAIAELSQTPATGAARPASAASLVAEARRATVRALRSRLADLDTASFEHVCSALLEKMGMRDLRIAKRSKEGPLYLARQRRGVSDLRVAVRLVRGKREISRQDVQELRKDLSHYSAQMALLLAPGEAGRESRTEASAAAQPPVVLYAGEALAEELVTLRVGVSVQVVEISDVDEAFFAAAAAKAQGRPGERKEERVDERFEPAPAEPQTPAQPVQPSAAQPEAAPAQQAPQQADDRRPNGRQQGRRDDKPRLLSPAEQAWGQPAGTLKKGALPPLLPVEAEGAAPAPAVEAAATSADPAAASGALLAPEAAAQQTAEPAAAALSEEASAMPVPEAASAGTPPPPPPEATAPEA
jgi:ribonuclease E